MIVLLLSATALILSGCGSSPPGNPATSASPPALDGVAGLDWLVVVRTDAFPANHLRFAFPARIVVTDPNAVRAVARALLALPKQPAGVVFGPVDLGITYRLVFSAADGRRVVVKVDATGVEAVTGLGSPRSATGAMAFWRTLGLAMGLAQPTWVTFRGSR